MILIYNIYLFVNIIIFRWLQEVYNYTQFII